MGKGGERRREEDGRREGRRQRREGRREREWGKGRWGKREGSEEKKGVLG